MDKLFAPSYLAAVVSILLNMQGMLGLEFTSDEITATITVLAGLVIAIRQVVTGRSTVLGGRPQ